MQGQAADAAQGGEERGRGEEEEGASSPPPPSFQAAAGRRPAAAASAASAGARHRAARAAAGAEPTDCPYRMTSSGAYPSSRTAHSRAAAPSATMPAAEGDGSDAPYPR